MRRTFCNSNRRTSKRRTKSKQLPGVSPLVFSRFLHGIGVVEHIYLHSGGGLIDPPRPAGCLPQRKEVIAHGVEDNGGKGIEGTFSEEGLAAMSDVKDLTSQMAKELALGIRDNVEDIAAAFRKMAVINPERKKNIAAAQLKETAAEEQKAPAAKDSFGVRTAQAQVRQALYEGLLARTAEEQKKRKSKKAEVDENQLSIFGFAA